MNRHIFIVIAALVFISGCSGAEKSPPAIRIGTTAVSLEEFEKSFKNSPYAVDGSPSAKADYLDAFITRKLILKEAEKQGLDKDPDFLNNLESFWQQSLVKLVLERKAKELLASTVVSDDEIRNFYDKNKETLFKGKDLQAVYGQVKWVLVNMKQEKIVSDWAAGLKRNTKIVIDYGALHLPKEGGRDDK